MIGRLLLIVAAALPCGGGCVSTSFLLSKPMIDASLLLPCTDPILAPDEASDNEIAAERLRLGKAYLDCKARHGALAGRVKE